MTQEFLALQCSIDRSYMGRIERGEVNLTVEKLYEIAKILKIHPQELLPNFQKINYLTKGYKLNKKRR